MIVTAIILNSTNPKHFIQILRLLRGAIVYDYHNFVDPQVVIAPEEKDIYDEVEQLLRERLYDQLVAARNDISGLDTMKLLKRDLKIIQSKDNTAKIAIPFFPITVEVTIPNQLFSTKPSSSQYFGS